jgi:formylglycine-generating enzyme required for sulfatase activity
MPGSRPVPDYELMNQLGRGGFGEVWKAKGPGGFAVALKFIRLGNKAGAVELRSLEVMKNIRHPNLLDVFGAWQREGFLIVAMQLADRSLLDRLAEATAAGLPGIPPVELLEYMRDAARGIDHLNTLAIQHRDIKPHNLLLVGNGVRVGDFGLAKLVEHSVTGHSGAMTAAYAAPEFASNQTSKQSDQYSLAVSYCQLRSGRFPFDGSFIQVMLGHATQPPDLTMLPEAERPVVARALAKKPGERWPSCRAFVDALAADATRPAPTLPPPATAERLPGRPTRAKELAEEVINSVGMKLVLIPPGRFKMGSPPNEESRSEDEEQHEVEITQTFYLGAYLVTQAEYEQVIGHNPSYFSAQGGGKDKVARLETYHFPVEEVSWEDAVTFCRKLSRLPVEAAAKRTYRLPTEAEWEYACREGGRSTAPFYFGRSLSSAQANFNGNFPYGNVATGPYLERTTPVGTYAPNQFGLFDMHGNLWEWCQDWYDENYYRNSPTEDPQGPERGTHRVWRGGSWFNLGRYCRAAYRNRDTRGNRYHNFGFRVVLVAPAKTP